MKGKTAKYLTIYFYENAINVILWLEESRVNTDWTEESQFE